MFLHFFVMLRLTQSTEVAFHICGQILQTTPYPTKKNLNKKNPKQKILMFLLGHVALVFNF